MPDMPSVKVVKEFTYLGDTEEWSNAYHFAPSTPGDAAEWKSLVDAIWAEERKFLSSNVKIAAAYGYEAGNEVSVFQVDYREPPLTQSAGLLLDANPAPGDAAVWLRWRRDNNSSKGRPVYVRNYYHGVPSDGADAYKSAAKTAMLAYGEYWLSGDLPGSAVRCGPQGQAVSTPKAAPFFTTRTLHRRGKRP